MKKIIGLFLRYPIWANVVMVGILLFGYTSLKGLRTSFFPESSPGKISVNLVYPGASPKEIEEALVTKIEERLKGIAGVDRYRSVSRENVGYITVVAEDKADIDEVYEDVKNAVDMVSPWPADAYAPKITKMKFGLPAVVVVLSGLDDLWSLKLRAQELEDDFLNMDNISQVNVTGYPKREIVVELSQEAMRAHKISFMQVSNVIKSNNADLSAGKIEGDMEKFNIRLYGKEANVEHIENIVLKTDINGAIVHVGDIANVVETWDKSSVNIAKYNGRRSIIFVINQSESQNLLDVSKDVLATVKVFKQKYPKLKIDIPFDSTILVKSRIDMLVKNGILGLVLVFITLMFFLKTRVAFWVAAGIPFAFAGTFIIASMAGITINMITLFGMIVVVGILVDDAIVVAEQIFQGIEKGMSPLVAAHWGVNKVIAPVFASVMTTVLAFVPFFFFTGMMGKMMWQMSLIIIGALTFSLLESFIVLPSHLAHSKGMSTDNSGKLRKKIENFYTYVTYELYGKILTYVLTHKRITVSIPIAILFVTVGLFKGGLIKTNPFPMMDSNEININVSLAAGTQESITDSILTSLEKRVVKLGETLKKEYGYDIIKSTRTLIGSNDLDDKGSSAGQLTVELVSGEFRNVTSMDIKTRLRKAIPVIPQAQKITFGSGGHWGKPLSISLTSTNTKKLIGATKYLKEKLKSYAVLKDIVDLNSPGPREIQIRLKPEGYALGFTQSDVVLQVRQAYYGIEIQKIQRGKDEISIWTRYDDNNKKSIYQLGSMLITTKDGRKIPFEQIATYDIKREAAAIKHIDGKREIRIEADLKDKNTSSSEIVSEIKTNTMPEFNKRFSDVKWSFRGQSRENSKFMKSAAKTFIPALIGIMVILILIFHSWVQASLIFLMIPLGIIGGVYGHLIHVKMLTQMSIMGFIALSGIVINDSIVFVDQINYNLKSKMKLYDAVYQAGLLRLRPILMTTITTVAGLMPLILERSFQAQFLIPMAITVSWGLIFGSVFILTLLPVLYMVLNIIRLKVNFAKQYFLKIITGREIVVYTAETIEPAVQDMLRNENFEEEINE